VVVLTVSHSVTCPRVQANTMSSLHLGAPSTFLKLKVAMPGLPIICWSDPAAPPALYSLPVMTRQLPDSGFIVQTKPVERLAFMFKASFCPLGSVSLFLRWA